MSIEEARLQAGGVSDRTLRREIRDGKLRATRVRGRLLIDRADLNAWIESCKEPDPHVNDSDPAATGSTVTTSAAGVGRVGTG
jgi:excisionase family DNA binding protein